MNEQNFTPLQIGKSNGDKFHNSILDKQNHTELLLWVKTFAISVLLLVLFLGYQLATGSKLNKYSISSASASVSVILIGLSFALSSICYFFNFADKKIIYRKYLGVIGFFYAVLHTGISFFLYPKKPPLEHFLNEERRIPFLLGLGALVIFFMMAVISNKFAVRKLGGKLWRNLLRVGYIAYFLVMLHVIVLNTDSSLTFPPSTFLIAIIIVFIVFLLRLMLYLRTRKKSSLQTNPAPSQRQSV